MTELPQTDRGEPDPRLRAAQDDPRGDPGNPDGPAGRAALLAALIDARVFAAVTATATGRERAVATGLSAESGAQLAVVLLETPDGSRALPVFSDLTRLATWSADERPVPLTGAQACAAALDEGASVLLLDPESAPFTVTAAELTVLAGGFVPVTGSPLSFRQGGATLLPADGPEPLVAALGAALAGEGLRAARLLQGNDGLVVGVTAARPLEPAELAALAGRVVARLGPALPADGLNLAQVPDGPGRQLLKARPRRFTRRGR